MKVRTLIVSAVTATALAAGGTAYAVAGDSDDTAPRSPEVTLTEAAATAEKAADGTAFSAELDDDGTGAWEVDVRAADGTWHEVKISADTGKVLKNETDDKDDKDDD